MIYKRNNPDKVIAELHSTFTDRICPHCNKHFIEMVYIKYNDKKKEVESHPNRESVCCVKTGNVIANVISRIFEQN